MTTALEGGEGSASRPGRSLPLGKTRYPLYKRLGGSQGQSGQVRKISPPSRIRSPDRPAPSQSLYNYATRPTLYRYRDNIKIIIILAHTLESCCFCIPSIPFSTQYAELPKSVTRSKKVSVLSSVIRETERNRNETGNVRLT